MIGRLMENGTFYAMEANVDKTKVIRISTKPSRLHIVTNQKELEKVII
jgi:hypothetical protein